MKLKYQRKVRNICLSALIAALYIVLTLLCSALGLSSGPLQLRISEALCVLVCFTPSAVTGLTLGCLISNLIASANILDIVFGTLATFLGALGGYCLRKYKYLVTLPTLAANTLIIPLVIVYGFGVTDTALPLVALGIGVGEFISATLLGTALLMMLQKYKFKL